MCFKKKVPGVLSELKLERLHSNKVSTIVSLRNGYIADVMLLKYLISTYCCVQVLKCNFWCGYLKWIIKYTIFWFFETMKDRKSKRRGKRGGMKSDSLKWGEEEMKGRERDRGGVSKLKGWSFETVKHK